MSEKGNEKQETPNAFEQLIATAISSGLLATWVAAPGIVDSFDVTAQTVTVKVAINKIVTDPETGEESNVEHPALINVPLVFPRAGGYALTLPVAAGDEVLLVFSDRCIDGWFEAGAVGNQVVKRMHNPSDAFAILGVGSAPNALSNYDPDYAQFVHESSGSFLQLQPTKVVSNVSIEAPDFIDAITGFTFKTHVHTAPSGGGTTTPPNA